VPALAQLKAQHGIELDIVSSLAAPLPSDRFDVLITRDLALGAAEQWQLAREQVLCVCAPALFARLMAEPRLSWPFIVASSRPDVMSAWAPVMGLGAAQIERVASYDHYFLAIAAAIGGLGLLVAPRLLVQRHIADGTLVAVPHSAQWTGASYCAYAHPQSEKAALSAAFSRWFKAHLRELGDAV
jgi:LysR family transcriptional regulator, glycine cleavage system transcriptional activator